MIAPKSKPAARPILSAKRWGRLQPFLRRKEVRQRLILYLVAANYTVGELVRMTKKELRAVVLHPDMARCRDEMLELFPEGGLAFVFPKGNGMKHTNIYRILRMATETETGAAMSQEQFRAWLENT